VKTSGILHEKKDNQEIMLVTQGEKANPSLFKQLILKEEKTNELYFTRLTYYDKEEIYDYSYVNCTVDLSQIPKGFYKMALFFYGKENYKNNNLPPILIVGDKKDDKEVKLIDIFANLTEYKREQFIKLKINKEVRSSYSLKGHIIIEVNITKFLYFAIIIFKLIIPAKPISQK
jgi:hypothetical protein